MAAAFLFAAALLAAVSASPVTLTLERAFPSDHGVELSQLRAWDSLRHRRMLQSTNYVVNFPVKGTFDPSQVGLYFTKVKLGTPPREFYVQIDTGSDVLWVSCGSCNGCPQTSGLPIQLNYFDPGSSSTSSLISCSDRRCRNGVQSSDASCSGQSNQCTYTFQYGDGSGTSGYYVSDLMHFASIFEGSLTTNSSASVVFGPHYNLNLQSISVNGQILPIDPAVFATSNNRGTIVDSGTTLAYLAEEAYNPFVNAITAAIPQSVRSVLSRGNQCYLITTSSNVDIFPQVSLNFAGGASLVLRPQDYLMPQNYIGEGSVWCIGFQKIPGQSVTILGDLVLKDKIFVYDLAGQRIGWANYDCSLPVNVSASAGRGRSEFVDAGEINGSTCSRDGPHMLIKTLFLALFMHITLFL
ncbi:aspartic proteinase-like protein 2 isoform X2 [Cajanus cajan]|uniref:aspartic proteinase-like protein 2 isoform X2 n=1 Tax=Cajanus cajan TaxID=3821 RepID=UPI00098DAFF6|nr:aspartic proteinase-like protein 2 isoform X2 [Cajanus cajan]